MPRALAMEGNLTLSNWTFLEDSAAGFLGLSGRGGWEATYPKCTRRFLLSFLILLTPFLLPVLPLSG